METSILKSISNYNEVLIEFHPDENSFRLRDEDRTVTEWLSYSGNVDDYFPNHWDFEGRPVDELPVRLLSELTDRHEDLNRAFGEKYFHRYGE